MTQAEIVEKYRNRGLEGDDIYKGIIESSQRSRQSVNDKLGIDNNKENNTE